MLSSAAELLDTEVSSFSSTPAKLVELLCDPPEKTSWFSKFISPLPVNDTVKQVLYLGLTKQKEYLTQLLNFNNERRSTLRLLDQSRGPVYEQSGGGFVHRFNQMPCDLETRKRRSDLFEKRGLHKQKILLLGDDDLLSHELSNREFSQVMVADCDRQLLERIQQLTAHSQNPPTLFEADFSKGFKSPLAANVACLDPAHHFSCAKVFVERAVENLDATQKRTIFLMINPYILGRLKTLDLIEILRKNGFYLVNHFEKFNAYPLDLFQKLFVRACWKFLLRKKTTVSSQAQHYFFSDCFEFHSYPTKNS